MTGPGKESLIGCLGAAWRNEIRPIAGVERMTIAEMAGGPGGKAIDIRISGADLPVLKQAALDVRQFLKGFPGLLDIDDNLPYGKEEMIIELELLAIEKTPSTSVETVPILKFSCTDSEITIDD